MNPKIKNTIKKVIYGILFTIMVFSFIYLSEKYAGNNNPKVITINDFYPDIKTDKFEIIRGQKFISLIKSGKNIIFVGSGSSNYSQKYILELEKVLENDEIDKIYYYDINNDKSQKNSNYYTIKELLNGYLITTDGSNNNLLAPSLYIIEDGEVKYYNIETVAMKNTNSLEDYWTKDQEERFYKEVNDAIEKYYLNK